MRTKRQLGYEAAATARAKESPSVIAWREDGGYEGAVGRQRAATGKPVPAIGHMPFPGFKHCGETM